MHIQVKAKHVKSFADAKTAKDITDHRAVLDKAAEENEKAQNVVAQFRNLESTFVSSNDNDGDLAPDNANKVVLENAAVVSSLQSSISAVASPGLSAGLRLLSKLFGGGKQEPAPDLGLVTGVANLNSEGKVDSLDAKVSNRGSKSFRMTTSGDGSRTYVIERAGKYRRARMGSGIYGLHGYTTPGRKQVVVEKNGVLTLLEDSNVPRKR